MCNDFLYSFLNSHRVQESNIPISQYTVTIKRRTATTAEAGAGRKLCKSKKDISHGNSWSSEKNNSTGTSVLVSLPGP